MLGLPDKTWEVLQWHLDCGPFMNDGIKSCALFGALVKGSQFWISNRGLFGKILSFLGGCHEFRLGPSESNCLTSVKLLNSVENKMISARLKSNARTIDSCRSCRCSMKISQTRACNKFLAHSTIGKALSLCQRKTQLCSFKCEEPLVSHLSVCPVSSLVLCMSRFVEATSNRWNRGTLNPSLLFPVAKDCTLKKGRMFKFWISPIIVSLSRIGLWALLIPRVYWGFHGPIQEWLCSRWHGNGTAAILMPSATLLIRFTDLKPPAFCSFLRKVLIFPKLVCFKMWLLASWVQLNRISNSKWISTSLFGKKDCGFLL